MTINPTTVRANGSSLRGYLAVFRGAQVLAAALTADAALLSEVSLSISVTSGAAANVQRGYRVQFFQADGTTFKGESHVRWSGTLDSTHLPVREFSESEFLLVTGDVVKVFALMSFEDKLVTATDTFDPDGQPISTYNSAPRPLACSGGYDAGFVDGYETGTVLTYRTQITDGSHSRIVDPTSNPTHISHLWTLPAGVSFAPGSANTDVSPTLRVTVGEYTVYHDVTDTDNAQTWRQCVTYQCFDGVTRSPVGVIMESAPTGDPQNGWACTFRAVNFLSLTDAPDGALVLFFVRERINGSWQSLGGAAGRSAVKLLGYLNHDESELTPQLQFQRFEVISPLTRLGQLPGFSKVMFQNATPNDWSKVSTALTTLRAMIQLLRMYTFALDGGHDLLTSANLLNPPYPELWLQKESPRQQVDELADGVDARLTCTRNGLFRLDPQLALLDAATRAALTPVYTFGRRDVARLVARRNHFDTVETLELHATSASATGNPADSLPYFSRASGSPGHGADFITIERIIVSGTSSQDSTNQRAGRRYGLRNGVYTDASTGVKRRAPEVDLEMRGVYDVLDFDDQKVAFDSFPNPRDVDLTAFDWQLSKVRLDYASGKLISTFQALTDSPPGASYSPSTGSVVVPAPPPLVFPIAPPLTLLPNNGVLPTQGVCLSYSEGAAALITGLSGGTLLFDPWTTGITGTKFYDGCSNPYAYKQLLALSDAGLEYCADQSTKAAFSRLQSNAALFGGAYVGHRIRATINANGCFLVASGSNCLARTLNKFASVTQVSINGLTLAPSPSDADDTSCDLCPVERTAGHWLAIAPYAGDTTVLGLYRSTDNGATWALLWGYDGSHNPSTLDYGGQKRFWLDVPYTRIDGSPNRDDASLELWLYLAGDNHTGAKNQVILSQDRGASFSRSYHGTDYQYSGAQNTRPASTFTYGGGNAYFLDGGDVRRTTDGLSSVSAPLYFAGNTGCVSLNGWSSSPLAVISWTKQDGSMGVVVSLDGVNVAIGWPAGWAGGIAMAEFSLYPFIT